MLDPFGACAKATSARTGEHIVSLDKEPPSIVTYGPPEVGMAPPPVLSRPEDFVPPLVNWLPNISCEVPADAPTESACCGKQEDMTQRRMWERPPPMEFGEVWVCVPRSFRTFQRCHVCVDKLGVSFRPLIEADALPISEEVLWRGAVPAPIRGDLELFTQTIMLPLSSICDIIESSEESLTRLMLETDFGAGGVLERGPFARPRLDAARRNASALSPGEAEKINTTLPAQRRFSNQNTGMMDRLYADESRQESTNTQSSSSSDAGRQRKHVEPPHPHMIGIYVKGALACNSRSRRTRRPDGGRVSEVETTKEPASNTCAETVMVAICFKTALEGQQLISRARDFKRYALALGFSTFLDNLSGVKKTATEDGHSYIQQEASEWGLPPQEVDEVLIALQPPPQPDPNFDRKIPTMRLEDDGRVFWHFTKKKPLPQRGVNLIRFNSFQ